MNKQDMHTLAHTLTSLQSDLGMLKQALRGMLDCETLAVETWIIPPAGVVERYWHVDYHAVAVTSQSAQKVTIAAGPAGISAPTNGPGVAVFGANRCGVVNLTGHTLSIYGNPGDTVTIQVYARPQPPAWGS